jgi:transcriptional regulator with XRE-family HTH domain
MLRLKVKEVAESKGITDAAKLSRKTGIGYATAHRLMQGEITEDNLRSVGILTLYRVAQGLGVRIVDLLEEDRLARRAATAGTLHSVAG